MGKQDIREGQFYWLAGQGPMKLEKLPGPYEVETARFTRDNNSHKIKRIKETRQGTSYTFHHHSGGHYWASFDQIVREASETEARLFVENCRERGIVSADFVPCWDTSDC